MVKVAGHIKTATTYAFSDGFLCISKEDYEIELIQKDETKPIFEQGEVNKFSKEFIADMFKNGEPCIGYLNTADGLIAITFEGNGIWDREQYEADLVTFHQKHPYYRLYDRDEFDTQ